MNAKKILKNNILILTFILLIGIICVGCAKSPDNVEATFEGFYTSSGQEITDKTMVFGSDEPIYKFTLKNGDSKLFKICDDLFKDASSVSVEDGACIIQNKLKVGQAYNIKVENNTILDLEPVKQTQNVGNGITSYTPGEHTLKNFLKTAVSPMGTLMVVGGGWDLQDVGSGNESRTIGVDSVWKDEYSNQTVDYDWLKTYPHNGWNKDHFRGFDASGYLGWVLYNALYDTNLDHPGLVLPPNELIETLTKKYNFGESVDLKGMTTEEIAENFKPGDIVALDQHLYIVIGVCDDGSVVTVQCASAMSKSGVYGGGVQLSVFNPKNDLDEDCEAFRLVDEYMKEFCPEWTERYDTAVKMNKYYLDITGIARMDLEDGIFTDPDGYTSKKPAEILEDIFK